MQSVALVFRKRSCLSISWAVWRRQYYQKCSGHKMNILALQHWAQSLQFRAWLQWRELYLHTQNEKQKDTRAVTHHQHWELRRCMGAWLGYLNLHRVKKRQNELAQEFHRSRRLQRCFSDWQLAWECRRRMRAHGRDLEKQAARIALWRAFAHWKHLTDVVLCVEEAQQCELAEKHYKCHLLELGLKALRQNVLDTRLQRMRTNLSSCQHRVTVLQKYWNRWKSRLEEKEEEQQQALTAMAHARYRRVLMRQVFDTWLLKTCKLQGYRMGEKMAVLHFQRRLLCCSWSCWRGRAAARLEEQEGLARAGEHYSNQLLLKAFCLWKQKTQERETERLKETKALRFHCSKCLQQTWNKWREYVEHQREKWRKLVQADLHYQHVLLGKTLAAWKIYQQNIQCILYQVAEKEEQHTRLLLREVLCTWRENALALIHESEATARADEHYRRAVLSKVLLQWRDTAWLRACHRHLKVTAVLEARKQLDLVRLQSLFLHWKESMRESLMLRAQHHRAAQHHQQHLLQKYLVKWKHYHQQCLGKKVRRISSLPSLWGVMAVAAAMGKAEDSASIVALVPFSAEKADLNPCPFVIVAVFDAWLRFAKEQQEKKDGTEKVTVHHPAPLREGVTCALRNTAGIKQLQGQLHTQPQLESYTRAAVQCKHQPPHREVFVTVLASDRNAIQRARLAPRKPDFPLESLESKELLRPPFTRSEVPFQQTSVNKCPAQTGNLMLTPHMEESTCKCLSQMDSAAHPHPSLTCASLPTWTQDMHRAGQGPELCSPASFRSHMRAGSEERGGQPANGHKGAHSQDSQQNSVEKKLPPNLQPHLLSSEELVGKGSHHTAGTSSDPNSSSCSCSSLIYKEWMSVLPPLLVPYIFHSAEGEKREHSSREEMMLERKVEVELWHIQQQMQYYYSRKQELKCCQQQAQILQQWLEMSTQPGAQDGVQGVQEELGQLQVRISTLTKAQLAERQHVQALLARLRDIQLALDL
ncbi:hypothetical protein EK904_002698 [Melospiza melodia maxima]|nr:hypothetical protein EK904_002698 [Melospiza melodia maxima]